MPTVVFSDESGNPQTFPTTTASGIPYIEFIDGYNEKFSREETEATRILACRYADRLQFASDMIGYSAWAKGTSVGGVITNMSRVPPEQHPDMDNLWCTNLELVEGMGVPPTDIGNLATALSSAVSYGSASASMRDPQSNLVTYNLMKYRATYRTLMVNGVYSDSNTPAPPAFPALGELYRMVVKEYQMVGENMKVPGGGFLFVTDQKKLFEPPPRVVGTVNVVYKWMEVPIEGFNFQAALDTLGQVNQLKFDNFYAPGTLLLGSVDLKRYKNVKRISVQDVTYNYLQRDFGLVPGGDPNAPGRKGHNFIYRQSAPNDFIEVSTDGVARWSANPQVTPPPPANVCIYSSTDFMPCYILLGGGQITEFIEH